MFDHLDTKHVLLAFAVLYSVVWIAIGMRTGVMTTARGKYGRAAAPKQFWTQLALRGSVGAVALYLLAVGI